MVSTSLKKYVVLAASFLFLTTTALAVENFRVPVAHLRVYSQPSTLSAIIAILNQGQTIQAGSNPAGGFKKVLVVDKSGKKKIGYVALSDLPGGSRSAVASKRSRPSRSSSGGGGAGLRGHWSGGIVGGIAYDMESGRTITDSSGNTVTSNSLSGTAPEFGAFLHIPWGRNILLKPYFYYKSSSLSGTYPFGGATPTISITQSFVSIGGLLQYYLGNSWWVGPALQLDYGLSATAQLGAQTFSLSTNQFVGIFAVTGYDFGLTDNIYLTPELQFGADVNASPVIIEGNFLLNFSYKF